LFFRKIVDFLGEILLLRRMTSKISLISH